MDFMVSAECIRLGLRAGAVVFRGVATAPAAESLRQAIDQEARRVQVELAQPNAIRSLPEVMSFHEVLRKVGVNPRREQSSVERLLGFALKRGTLPAINSLVDAYNLVSIRSRCSLGAHDLDLIRLPVLLRRLTGRESFTPLGSDRPQPVKAGEYGYVDAADRLLCRLDILQADFSKVTERTVNAILIIEGTSYHSPEHLRRTFAEAIELVTRHCGGTADIVAWPDFGRIKDEG